MDGWADHLHTSFYGEHVLLPGLRLTSLGTYVIAAVLSAFICFTERSLTFALSRHWAPFRAVRQSRAHSALWRSGLYALATLLRLLYMLLSMTFHVWLILVIVVSLTAGQFLIEYYEHPRSVDSPDHRNPYHHLSFSSPPRTRRARGRTKPPGLFIHPKNSNIARADAAALELGLRCSTERANALRTSSDSDDSGAARTHDHGRGAGHALNGSPKPKQPRTNKHTGSSPDFEQKLFQVGESGSESDD
ncbi:hypothetical protein F5148DRAFT_919176 [Russula earlei]|uniref:Uncharacterized protein n=1 Tax=Russula earlei TaxID=71964 RepID=A0ACC0UAL0_9AGAM|nr:hypothetical protein F5148DRAFT_919176 [Russula earlei]